MIYEIQTTQTAIHKDTIFLARRYSGGNYARPIDQKQIEAFELASRWISDFNKPLILDSGCGTGESSLHIAKIFPEHFVLGIDRSNKRLEKNHILGQKTANNCGVIRANLEDIWRLAAKHKWEIDRHYILYPNPWPKIKHLNKRWHGHPVFSTMLGLSKHLEIRSDWEIYVAECAIAIAALTGVKPKVEEYKTTEPITAFERKYWQSGRKTYRLST